MTSLLEYWKEFSLFITFVWGAIATKRLNKATADKEEALASQERIKVQKEDVALSQMIQETYQRLNKDVFQRLDDLEKSNLDLTKKYSEILLKNAILVERAESYEKKYLALENDYTKLKSDYKKLGLENKEIRKELDELKNSAT